MAAVHSARSSIWDVETKCKDDEEVESWPLAFGPADSFALKEANAASIAFIFRTVGLDTPADAKLLFSARMHGMNQSALDARWDTGVPSRRYVFVGLESSDDCTWSQYWTTEWSGTKTIGQGKDLDPDTVFVYYVSKFGKLNPWPATSFNHALRIGPAGYTGATELHFCAVQAEPFPKRWFMMAGVPTWAHPVELEVFAVEKRS